MSGNCDRSVQEETAVLGSRNCTTPGAATALSSVSSAVTLRSEGVMTWLVRALCLNVSAEDAEDGAAPEQSQVNIESPGGLSDGEGNKVALKLMKTRTKHENFLHELCVSIHLSGNEGIIFTPPIYVDSDNFYVLTQDLAPAGTLHSIIEPGERIPEVTVKHCALQLARVLGYMHDQRLVHGLKT
ncbi:unnamed protein product [Ranitomeya imitator]|uniref:Protein kinase domain-containing protein n=1 Tax=Ranitomeya imitator TaxID=111125 RepID=A0ABN9LMQ9_9NEOB|nr:unnamed protein product [Ranitomeya imitator]